MDAERFDKVVTEYKNRYLKVLKEIWPTINGNGFNEPNQTVNFINAYEKVAKDESASSWYEFQINNHNNIKKKDNRVDGLIINHTTKSVYLIEAKRFSKNTIGKKRKDLGNDAERIINLDYKTRFEEFFRNGESIIDYSVYGILLFDLWTYAKKHKNEAVAYELWKSFCSNYDIKKLSEFFSFESNTEDRLSKVKNCFLASIQDVISYESSEYHLGVLLFKVNTNIK